MIDIYVLLFCAATSIVAFFLGTRRGHERGFIAGFKLCLQLVASEDKNLMTLVSVLRAGGKISDAKI